MITFIKKRQDRLACRVLNLFICITFISTLIVPPGSVRAQVAPMPAPGTIVPVSPGFTPALVRGIKIHPENPLRFDFIIAKGDSNLSADAFKAESQRLIKYFLASLTTPEDDLWVNLSPYEGDRIIPAKFGVTEMGRDLLAQDYLLKQLTASLMYPEEELGQNFWQRVRERAQELYGTVDIPMSTFNKVWIVPDRAVVYERGDTAFVADSHLKVMLEEDYVALKSTNSVTPHKSAGDERLNKVTTEIIREVILPEIEKEVNEGENFAQLRQIYSSMILATWYKRSLRQSLLGRVYVDQNKVKGIDLEDTAAKQKIYEQYLAAYKKGVFNYIREDEEASASSKQMVPRKYFSGGFEGKGLDVALLATPVFESLPQPAQANLTTMSPDTSLLVPVELVENAGRDEEDLAAAVAAPADVAMLSEPEEVFGVPTIEAKAFANLLIYNYLRANGGGESKRAFEQGASEQERAALAGLEGVMAEGQMTAIRSVIEHFQARGGLMAYSFFVNTLSVPDRKAFDILRENPERIASLSETIFDALRYFEVAENDGNFFLVARDSKTPAGGAVDTSMLTDAESQKIALDDMLFFANAGIVERVVEDLGIDEQAVIVWRPSSIAQPTPHADPQVVDQFVREMSRDLHLEFLTNAEGTTRAVTFARPGDIFWSADDDQSGQRGRYVQLRKLAAEKIKPWILAKQAALSSASEIAADPALLSGGELADQIAEQLTAASFIGLSPRRGRSLNVARFSEKDLQGYPVYRLIVRVHGNEAQLDPLLEVQIRDREIVIESPEFSVRSKSASQSTLLQNDLQAMTIDLVAAISRIVDAQNGRLYLKLNKTSEVGKYLTHNFKVKDGEVLTKDGKKSVVDSVVAARGKIPLYTLFNQPVGQDSLHNLLLIRGFQLFQLEGEDSTQGVDALKGILTKRDDYYFLIRLDGEAVDRYGTLPDFVSNKDVPADPALLSGGVLAQEIQHELEALDFSVLDESITWRLNISTSVGVNREDGAKVYGIQVGVEGGDSPTESLLEISIHANEVVVQGPNLLMPSEEYPSQGFEQTSFQYVALLLISFIESAVRSQRGRFFLLLDKGSEVGKFFTRNLKISKDRIVTKADNHVVVDSITPARGQISLYDLLNTPDDQTPWHNLLLNMGFRHYQFEGEDGARGLDALRNLLDEHGDYKFIIQADASFEPGEDVLGLEDLVEEPELVAAGDPAMLSGASLAAEIGSDVVKKEIHTQSPSYGPRINLAVSFTVDGPDAAIDDFIIRLPDASADQEPVFVFRIVGSEVQIEGGQLLTAYQRIPEELREDGRDKYFAAQLLSIIAATARDHGGRLAIALGKKSEVGQFLEQTFKLVDGEVRWRNNGVRLAEAGLANLLNTRDDRTPMRNRLLQIGFVNFTLEGESFETGIDVVKDVLTNDDVRFIVHADSALLAQRSENDAVAQLQNDLLGPILENYANVHRGAGRRSMASTALLEHAREVTQAYLGRAGDDDYTVIFNNERNIRLVTAYLDARRAEYRLISSRDIGLNLGVYALLVKKEDLPPITQTPPAPGGGSVAASTEVEVLWAEAPDRFEAGTPNIIGNILFGKALELIIRNGRNTELFKSARRKLSAADVRQLLLHDRLDSLHGEELLQEIQSTFFNTDDGVHVDHGASNITFGLIGEVMSAMIDADLDDEAKAALISEVKKILRNFLRVSEHTHDVVLTNNTTDAFNILRLNVARNIEVLQTQGKKVAVMGSQLAHNSDMLPFAKINDLHPELQPVDYLRLPIDEQGFYDVEGFRRLLEEHNGDRRDTSKPFIAFITVSAASNVLGSLNDIQRLVSIAHEYGAQIAVDGAQVLSHRAVDLAQWGADYFVVSSHKAYAPGSGALVARKERLNFTAIELADFNRSGEENLPGIAAFGKSLNVLGRIGMDVVAEHEKENTRDLVGKLRALSDEFGEALTLYGETDDLDRRIGVVTLTLRDYPVDRAAEWLADDADVGSRQGCFCAATAGFVAMGYDYEDIDALVQLVGDGRVLDQIGPRMLRFSLGLNNTTQDNDRIIASLRSMFQKLTPNRLEKELAHIQAASPVARSEMERWAPIYAKQFGVSAEDILAWDGAPRLSEQMNVTTGLYAHRIVSEVFRTEHQDYWPITQVERFEQIQRGGFQGIETVVDGNIPIWAQYLLHFLKRESPRDEDALLNLIRAGHLRAGLDTQEIIEDALREDNLVFVPTNGLEDPDVLLLKNIIPPDRQGDVLRKFLNWKSAIKRESLPQLALYSAGVIATTIKALNDYGVFSLFTDPATGVFRSVTMGEIVDFLENNPANKKKTPQRQYLHGVLRILGSLGWLVRTGKSADDNMSFTLTPRGEQAMQLVPVYAQVTEFTGDHIEMGQYLAGETRAPPASLQRMVELSRREWDLPQIEDQELRNTVIAHLNGYLIGPIILAMHDQGIFKLFDSDSNLNLEDILSRDGHRRGLDSVLEHLSGLYYAFDLLADAGFVTKKGTTVTLTSLGLAAFDRALSYGVPVSYNPSYQLAEEFLFGDAEAIERYKDGKEFLVHRLLNVASSGAAHTVYFRETDKIVTDLISDQLASGKIPQPEALAASGQKFILAFPDTGSGDGKMLARIHRVVMKTEYGRLMRAHPDLYRLEMIGVDYNGEARDATKARLDRLGISNEVLYGDINEPGDIVESVGRVLDAKYGHNTRRLTVHIRSVLDHNRPWKDVQDEDGLAGRTARSTGAFGWRGRAIPDEEIEQNLYEHFSAWKEALAQEARINGQDDFYLIVVELHTISEEAAAANLTRTLDISYQLSHLYSDQFIVEAPVVLTVSEEAGLHADPVYQTRYPRNPRLSTITINLFKGQEVAIDTSMLAEPAGTIEEFYQNLGDILNVEGRASRFDVRSGTLQMWGITVEGGADADREGLARRQTAMEYIVRNMVANSASEIRIAAQKVFRRAAVLSTVPAPWLLSRWRHIEGEFWSEASDAFPPDGHDTSLLSQMTGETSAGVSNFDLAPGSGWVLDATVRKILPVLGGRKGQAVPGMDLSLVSSAAALALDAADLQGKNDKLAVDIAAAQAMRGQLRHVAVESDVQFVHMIGEGDKDEVPPAAMLSIREKIGFPDAANKIEIGSDPVDGTGNYANFSEGAEGRTNSVFVAGDNILPVPDSVRALGLTYNDQGLGIEFDFSQVARSKEEIGQGKISLEDAFVQFVQEYARRMQMPLSEITVHMMSSHAVGPDHALKSPDRHFRAYQLLKALGVNVVGFNHVTTSAEAFAGMNPGHIYFGVSGATETFVVAQGLKNLASHGAKAYVQIATDLVGYNVEPEQGDRTFRATTKNRDDMANRFAFSKANEEALRRVVNPETGKPYWSDDEIDQILEGRKVWTIEDIPAADLYLTFVLPTGYQYRNFDSPEKEIVLTDTGITNTARNGRILHTLVLKANQAFIIQDAFERTEAQPGTDEDLLSTDDNSLDAAMLSDLNPQYRPAFGAEYGIYTSPIVESASSEVFQVRGWVLDALADMRERNLEVGFLQVTRKGTDGSPSAEFDLYVLGDLALQRTYMDQIGMKLPSSSVVNFSGNAAGEMVTVTKLTINAPVKVLGRAFGNIDTFLFNRMQAAAIRALSDDELVEMGIVTPVDPLFALAFPNGKLPGDVAMLTDGHLSAEQRQGLRQLDDDPLLELAIALEGSVNRMSQALAGNGGKGGDLARRMETAQADLVLVNTELGRRSSGGAREVVAPAKTKAINTDKILAQYSELLKQAGASRRRTVETKALRSLIASEIRGQTDGELLRLARRLYSEAIAKRNILNIKAKNGNWEEAARLNDNILNWLRTNANPDMRRLYDAIETAYMETVQQFVDTRIAPNAFMIDLLDVVPADIYQEMVFEDLVGTQFRQIDGGVGLSTKAWLRVNFAVSEVSSGVTLGALNVLGSLGPDPLEKPVADPEADRQRREVLVKLLHGEAIVNFDLTEPGAGSDNAGMKSKVTGLPEVEGEFLVERDGEGKAISRKLVGLKPRTGADAQGKLSGEKVFITVGTILPYDFQSILDLPNNFTMDDVSAGLREHWIQLGNNIEYWRALKAQIEKNAAIYRDQEHWHVVAAWPRDVNREGLQDQRAAYATITAFLVQSKASGVLPVRIGQEKTLTFDAPRGGKVIARKDPVMGQRGSGTTLNTYDGVPVDLNRDAVGNLITFYETLSRGRFTISAHAVGMIRGLRRVLTAAIAQREQQAGRSPVLENALTSARALLEEISALDVLYTQLLEQGADRKDKGEDIKFPAALAKILAPTASTKFTAAVRVMLVSLGYYPGSSIDTLAEPFADVSRYADMRDRDTKLLEIGEGTTQVQQVKVVAPALLKAPAEDGAEEYDAEVALLSRDSTASSNPRVSALASSILNFINLRNMAVEAYRANQKIVIADGVLLRDIIFEELPELEARVQTLLAGYYALERQRENGESVEDVIRALFWYLNDTFNWALTRPFANLPAQDFKRIIETSLAAVRDFNEFRAALAIDIPGTAPVGTADTAMLVQPRDVGELWLNVRRTLGINAFRRINSLSEAQVRQAIEYLSQYRPLLGDKASELLDGGTDGIANRLLIALNAPWDFVPDTEENGLLTVQTKSKAEIIANISKVVVVHEQYREIQNIIDFNKLIWVARYLRVQSQYSGEAGTFAHWLLYSLARRYFNAGSGGTIDKPFVEFLNLFGAPDSAMLSEVFSIIEERNNIDFTPGSSASLDKIEAWIRQIAEARGVLEADLTATIEARLASNGGFEEGIIIDFVNGNPDGRMVRDKSVANREAKGEVVISHRAVGAELQNALIEKIKEEADETQDAIDDGDVNQLKIQLANLLEVVSVLRRAASGEVSFQAERLTGQGVVDALAGALGKEIFIVDRGWTQVAAGLIRELPSQNYMAYRDIEDKTKVILIPLALAQRTSNLLDVVISQMNNPYWSSIRGQIESYRPYVDAGDSGLINELQQPASIFHSWVSEEFERSDGTTYPAEYFHARVVNSRIMSETGKGGTRWKTGNDLMQDSDFVRTLSILNLLNPTEDQFKSFLEKWVTDEDKALSLDMTMKLALLGLPLGGAKGAVLFAKRVKANGRWALTSYEPWEQVQQKVKNAIAMRHGYDLAAAGKVGLDIDIPAPDVRTTENGGYLMALYLEGVLRYFVRNKPKEIGSIYPDLQTDLEALLDEAEQDKGLRTEPVLVRKMVKYWEDGQQLDPPLPMKWLGIFTGKPVALGGILGRGEATGYGAADVIKTVYGDRLKGKTVAIQGFGNGGMHLAERLIPDGAVLQWISDSETALFKQDGFTVEDLAAIKAAGRITNAWNQGTIARRGVQAFQINKEIESQRNQLAARILESRVDILVPFALQNAINSENSMRINAKAIFEGANGATTANAKRMLASRKIPVYTGILTNAGGVYVSYRETGQAVSGRKISAEEIDIDRRSILVKATAETVAKAEALGVSIPDASYLVAIDHLIAAKASGPAGKGDAALLVDQKPPVGGIDLNPVNLNLQIKRDGAGVPLPVDLQDVEHMQVEGFFPVILDVIPIPNLPMLLGLSVPGTEDQQNRASSDTPSRIPAAYFERPEKARIPELSKS